MHWRGGELKRKLFMQALFSHFPDQTNDDQVQERSILTCHSGKKRKAAKQRRRFSSIKCSSNVEPVNTLSRFSSKWNAAAINTPAAFPPRYVSVAAVHPRYYHRDDEEILQIQQLHLYCAFTTNWCAQRQASYVVTKKKRKKKKNWSSWIIQSGKCFLFQMKCQICICSLGQARWTFINSTWILANYCQVAVLIIHAFFFVIFFFYKANKRQLLYLSAWLCLKYNQSPKFQPLIPSVALYWYCDSLEFANVVKVNAIKKISKYFTLGGSSSPMSYCCHFDCVRGSVNIFKHKCESMVNSHQLPTSWTSVLWGLK